MRRNQTRHSTDRRGLERWEQRAEGEQLYKVLPSLPPSIPPSITLPFLSLRFFFFVVVAFQLFIYFSRCFFISNSVPLLSFGATEGAAALTRQSGHKDWNKETQRSYSENISISLRNTNYIDTEWTQPLLLSIFTLPPSHLPFFSFLFSLSARPLPRCYGVLFINMCKSLFLSTRGVTSTGLCRRLTPPLRFIAWASSPESDDRAGTQRARVKRVCKRKKKWKQRWEEREKQFGWWRPVLKGCRANMDADVFFSSKVLKLVGTSVTYDLGPGRMWESAGTRRHSRFLFYLLKTIRVTTVTAPVNPLSNTTNFITAVTVNERWKHTPAKNYIHAYVTVVLIAVSISRPWIFKNIYTVALWVMLCAQPKYTGQTLFVCPAVVEPVWSRTLSAIPHMRVSVTVNSCSQVQRCKIHKYTNWHVDRTILHAGV